MRKKPAPPLQVTEPATGEKAGFQKLAPGKGENYLPILHGPRFDRLMLTNTRKTPPAMDPITGVAKWVLGSVTIFIKNFKTLSSVRTSALKLLDIALYFLALQNHYGSTQECNRHIAIPLEKYMELCNLPETKASRDEARRRVKEDMRTLVNISMEGSEYKKGRQEIFAIMNIFTAGVIEGSNLLFSFSPEAVLYLVNAYVGLLSENLFRLDDRNPHTYPLARKLLLHNSMDNNQLKGTANIISVKKLLEVLQGLPTYDEVMRTDRAFGRRIREPFEKAMNDLLTGSVLEGWEYCNSKRANLTEEQLKDFSYAEFERRYISFRLLNAPDHTARLRAKAKRRKKKKS